MVAVTCVTLLLATLLLWAPRLPVTSGAALALLSAAALVAGWQAGRRTFLLVVLGGLPVIAVLGTSERLLADRWPDRLETPDTLVSGAICEFPRAQPGSWRFVLTTDPESRARGVPGRVLVSWYDSASRPAAPPAPGEQWLLNLRLRPPRGLSNPGTFDYERWLFSQHIGATGWVRESAANGRVTGGPSACPPAAWRAATARRVGAVLDGREAAPYVLGLAIGAYQALPEAEWHKLRRTGTIHLISISGFHIALVAAPAALVGLAIARLMLAVGWRCRPRVLAAWTALGAAAGYGALAGFSVPTARSVIAVAIVAVLVTCRRAVTVPELLACVVLGVLLVEPLAPLVPGFWLSFAGVMVLATVALGLPAGRAKPGALRLLLVTQLAMTAGLAPLLAMFFGQFPVSGLVTNLVAVPAFSFVLLPLTLAGTAAVWVAPAAGAVLLGLAADCFDAWRWFLGACASLPGAVWYLPEPSRGALLLASAGAVSALWPPPWPGRWLGLCMLAGLLAAGAPPVPAGGLRVTALDVGQGLAVLVQTAGHALLYDAGPAFRDSDAGERVVVPVLQSLGVRTLDTLLISHADVDHRGGGASVLERYPGARVLGPAGGSAAGRAGACEAGRAWRWDGVLFEILHPVAGSNHPHDNAASCVLRVSGPRARLLLPGDIEASQELELASKSDFGQVDLLLAPHHGSRTSSSAPFVGATQPSHVVVSSGYRNRWRHPASDVVARWRESGACVLNTAEAGALGFEAGAGEGFRLRRAERESAPGIWLARPQPRPRCN
ncbi:MAG: ComEC/Rec2 family competence protein [Chromatiales bacterium]|nr:ComEC/Rec2 family competence protein [Chromatiales bacterium]